MSVKIGQFASQVSKQINPVDFRYWVLLPSFFGLLFSILIIVLWKPSFRGNYKYQTCKSDNNCTTKTGSIALRNLIIIIVMTLILMGIFSGIGYKIGFMIANPKISAGIYATGKLVDAFD